MGYSCRLGPAAGKAKIVVVSQAHDPSLKELERLPAGAEVIFRGHTTEDFLTDKGKQALQKSNVLLNLAGKSDLLEKLFPFMPELVWMHHRYAGVDGIIFPALANGTVCLTNARGQFSSALGEYVVLSCLYFAKDVDRWKRQQREKKWETYIVSEIKGSTLGVIGYGDIGQTAARMAKRMGMKIIGQRRRPELSVGDDVADEVLGESQVGEVIAKSDYILVAAALTEESKGMVGAEELAKAQPHAVIINIGRGPLIDEGAMTAMLQDGRLRGAALDVFCTEPLPTDSPLWTMENVLISPHSADLTAASLYSSVQLFVDGMPGFLAGEEVSMHRVDTKAGY